MASQYPPSPARPFSAVLKRWGLGEGDRIDRAALTDSLERLQVDERPLSPAAPARIRPGPGVREVIVDALAVADACEADHAADARWPHGLSDRLVDLLEGLERHESREDAAVLPLFLSGGPTAQAAAASMAGEPGSLRHRLDALAAATRDYEAPALAGAKWRVLYLLCRKIDFEIRAQMKIGGPPASPEPAAPGTAGPDATGGL